MSKNKLISIITPAYNCSNTILETFDSIKKQSYSNWEWIVVDDCSSDNTFDILSNLARQDSRIIVLKTPKNSGTAAARNVGTDKAKGQFIAFLDADDLWKPEKLQTQINYMVENDLPITYSNYDVLFPNGKLTTFAPKKKSANYNILLRRNDIGCLTVMYDSLKIGKVYMPLDAKKREDYAAWLDVTKKGVVATKIDKSLSIYRLGSETLTSNKKKMIKYHFRVYRRHEKMGVIKSFFYLVIFSLNKMFTKYN